MNGSGSLLSFITVLPDEPKAAQEGSGPREPREWTISPSSVALWIECERKWGLRYIAKLTAAPPESALLGTDGHAQAEAYLGGETNGLDFSRPSGAIMQAGMHLWPAPKTPGMHLERKFRFRSERTGFTYSGLKDIEIEPNVPVPSLGFDGWAPIVIDHKTTSSIEKYAKSQETLLYDSQTTIYGLDSMARYESPVVDLGWIYYQTKGARRAKPITMRVELAHTLRVFDAVEECASEMSSARDAFASASNQAPSPSSEAIAFVKSSMKPNPAACGAYGGCPYQHVCNLSPVERMRSALSMSLISDLKNRVQGTPSTTTNTDPPPAQTSEVPADHPLNKPYQPKSAEGAAAIGVPFTPPTEEPKEDPINPDESKLPPPAPENTTPPPAPASEPTEEKRKPGRPRGSKNKTEEVKVDTSSIQSQQVEGKIVCAAPERVIVPSESPKAPAPFAANKLFLYVDCMPEGVACVNADALVAKANAKIVAGGQVAHYKFLKFGEAAGALAIALNEVLDEEAPAYVFCSSTSDAMPTLTTRATMITRSVR